MASIINNNINNGELEEPVIEGPEFDATEDDSTEYPGRPEQDIEGDEVPYDSYLQFKRNRTIIIGRDAALENIDKYIHNFGRDGSPVLVRYRETEDSEKVKTIIAILGPDDNYSIYEDTDTVSEATKVFSSNESVNIKKTEDGYDLSILSKDIIEYLDDLASYKHTFKVSVSNATLKVNDLKPGKITATISSSMKRGIDANPTTLNITSSESASDGWTKISENKWEYSYSKDIDLTKNAIEIPFSATATNSENQSGNVSGTGKITIEKYWFIIEHDETDVTASEIDEYIDGVKQADLSGVGSKTNKETTWNQIENTYFWVLCPSNKTATVTQMDNSVMEPEVRKVAGTKHGEYNAYKSKTTQADGSKPVPDVIIS